MKFSVGSLTIRLVALTAASLFSLPASAQVATLEQKLVQTQQNPKAMEVAVEAGKKASFFCANCHGADGNSVQGEVPNLAGQNPAFLLEQIRKFGSGQRKNEFMQKLIKLLSEDDKLNIALYYAAQNVAARAPGDPALMGKGFEWYSKTCIRCHGPDGRGNDKIARIAGQQPTYLIQTLTRYRDKTGERYDPMMVTFTAPLKDPDIRAVAEYVSRLK